MGKIAYRFLPCGDDGAPRENSQYTTVADADERLGVGSVIDAELLGHRRWRVVEVRADQGAFVSAADTDGTPLPFGGTLVCRGV